MKITLYERSTKKEELDVPALSSMFCEGKQNDLKVI
jgi:hypothetical protein